MPAAAPPVLTAPSTLPATWQERLDAIVDSMREMSAQTDPQAMVRAYTARMRAMMQWDGHISLSRRDLPAPHVRVTRSHTFPGDVNPWRERDRLPVLPGGILSDLIYADRPRVIDDLSIAPDDPGAPFLDGMRTAVAIPHFHGGTALNMVVHLLRRPAAFPPDRLPELVLTSNLFGRATHNLVLADELRAAYDSLDREFQAVAAIQRSLLPQQLPHVPSLELASHYQTSRRAGGDYYDLFPLPAGRWGIFIADVSGHGTPAAVVMAITHSIAHSYPGAPSPPGLILAYLNDRLATRYVLDGGTFVTAFYGVYDPAAHRLTYACAGHNPPRLRRAGPGGPVTPIDGVAGLPLGILDGEIYPEGEIALAPGDLLLFYTDGITESFDPAGEMFGFPHLDRTLSAAPDSAHGAIDAILAAVATFTANAPAKDDRTLLAARVR